MTQITGTIINYYFHCKTQMWLHANRINLEAVKWQVHFIELDEVNERELLKVLGKISSLINQPKPPEVKFKKECRKCAYYEYCFI